MLQGKEFTDDDGVRRVITDVVFSHEDDVYYARYIIKGEKDIKKNHDYTILRQVFYMAKDGGGDWVEDMFYIYSLWRKEDRVVTVGIQHKCYISARLGVETPSFTLYVANMYILHKHVLDVSKMDTIRYKRYGESASALRTTNSSVAKISVMEQRAMIVIVY